MEVTVNFGDSINIYGIFAFCLMGYFNGYLFQEPGLYKIIAIIFVVPVCLQLLIDINIVYTATIPFLISALIGFWGMNKTKKNLLLAYDFTTEQFDRFR